MYVHVAVVLVVGPAVPAIGLPPSITKFTLPVGGLDPDVAVTVAVNITLWPYTEGFKEEATEVLVLTVGLLTVNPFVRVAVPPPGAGFVTETLRGPVAAPDPIVTFAVRFVPLFTVTVLTVMFAPKLTVVTPLMKFVPVKLTFWV